jgi:hypothetical protein
MKMKTRFNLVAFAVPILVLTSLPLGAADGIGGNNEKLIEIEGTVVDLLCEVAKKCISNCGEGKRQLGLRLGDGKVLVVAKSPDLFAGAQIDLAPHCGKVIKVDGILFENPKMPLYMVQGIKTDLKAKDYSPADGFVKAWIEKNGASDEWFRNDPHVKDRIAKTGPLGDPNLKLKAQ